MKIEKQKILKLLIFSIAFIILYLTAVLFFLFDVQILNAITSFQNLFLSILMQAVTHIATLYIGIPLILLIAFIKKRKIFYSLVAAIIIDLIIIVFLKIVVLRPRPFQEIGILVDTSFPSGHASRAFAVFGVLGYYYKKYFWLFYFIAGLVAFSRVYLGAHYPTDVLAGSLIGLLISQSVIKFRIGEKIHRKIKKLFKKTTFLCVVNLTGLIYKGVLFLEKLKYLEGKNL